MLRFYYDTRYKYTNRTLIDLTGDSNCKDLDYENIDSQDTINGHIIYKLEVGENIPSYVLDVPTGKRWYVSGITQLRTGKFQISMIRDVLSEGEYWKDERAYIEAGTANDYCKYKKWNLPFTNTKVKSERLNINGKSSFFVFYANQQNIDNNVITEDDLVLKYENIPGISTAQLEYSTLSDIPGYEYIGFKFAYIDKHGGAFNVSNGGTNAIKTYKYDNVEGFEFITIDPSRAIKSNRNLGTYWFHASAINHLALDLGVSNYIGQLTTSLLDPSLPISIVNKQEISLLESNLDKVIKVQDTGSMFKYYKIQKTYENYNANKITTSVSVNNSASIAMINYLKTSEDPLEKENSFLTVEWQERVVKYELIELGRGSNCELHLKANTAKLPRSSVRCVNIVSDSNISDEEISQLLMLCQTNANATEENIGRIIDIQYLPFSIATSTNENIKFGNNNATAEFITNDDFIFETNLDDLESINKETDSIIIVSPSRKSQFQFSPYNNDGNMEFSTRITIRPNQSVIYVRPSTKGLLMRDWDDKDCLIIQEDFSLTTITSQWTDYVYNNRNYQNAFNLEIQTKEYERDWERRIEKVQAQSDEWKAQNYEYTKDMAKSGNIPLISNISSTILSKWDIMYKDNEYMQAAQLDREYNEALYQKSIEVARTNFNYQIENVRTQPLVPNTITAIDVKMLDGIYLEYYSTNETELKSIQDYYIHNGNRIDNYGTFRDYYGTFIKGKIIISEHYNQPEIEEINRRLNVGIYTGGIV